MKLKCDVKKKTRCNARLVCGIGVYTHKSNSYHHWTCLLFWLISAHIDSQTRTFQDTFLCFKMFEVALQSCDNARLWKVWLDMTIMLCICPKTQQLWNHHL